MDQLDKEKELKKKEKKAEKQQAKAAKIAKAEQKKQKENGKEATKEDKKDDKKDDKKEDEKKLRLRDKEYVNTTPKGEKKDMGNAMADEYVPAAVESAWYDYWVAQGFFKPEYCTNPNAERFVIVIPPPNVTGSLHLGHALTNSIQDSICRWHRMSGKKVLWVPGTDHAGIATQMAVEKRLKKEGKSRHDLGREEFLKRVWEWKNQYGDRILLQLRRMGSSLDWTREVFTMDEKLSHAVNEAFVRMYDKGLIYRENRMVNWCCALKTAISDIEVEAEELEKKTKKRVPGYTKEYDFGLIYNFTYKVVDSNEEIEVATTRPETMLGDTGVAVHPDDPKYKHLHGKMLLHPFVDRKIPIITDSVLVDMNFGTGAVKVTPAHDFNDFECGKRNNLPIINILDDEGLINENGGKFKGMKRFEARDVIIVELKQLGQFKGSSPNKMVLKTCSRSGDIIEPLLKPQWWVNCQDLSRRAAEALHSGNLQIIPSRYNATWFEWLRDIRDWCISRQLWWGHRIPAWLVSIPGQPKADSSNPEAWIIGRDEVEARARAEKKFGRNDLILEQDPDVLDTWFSSGLFPFSVFGWPNETSDLKQYYPTQLLETGKDILFFWVLKMVMMGQELTGQLPFRQVFLHPIIRDPEGEKMTKSKGNVIDPVDVIEGITLEDLHNTLHTGNLDPRDVEKGIETQKRMFPKGITECGTDALRFALCSYVGGQGNDINIDIDRVEGYRKFCNKIWNAVRLAFTGEKPFIPVDFVFPDYDASKIRLTSHETIWDRWILSRLTSAIDNAIKCFETYELGEATKAIYSFWLYDFCDVYLEVIKPIMWSNDLIDADTRRAVTRTLFTCLETALRLLHPFMPFVTEELWQRLIFGRSTKDNNTFGPSICVATYPKADSSLSQPELESQLTSVMQIVHGARTVRQTYNLKIKDRPSLVIDTRDEKDKIFLSTPIVMAAIQSLAKVGDITVTLNEPTPPKGAALVVPNASTSLYVVIKDLVNIEVEVGKLEKQSITLEEQIANLKKKTNTNDYETKTPAKVKEANKTKLDTLEQELINAKAALENMRAMKQ